MIHWVRHSPCADGYSICSDDLEFQQGPLMSMSCNLHSDASAGKKITEVGQHPTDGLISHESSYRPGSDTVLTSVESKSPGIRADE